MTLNKRGAQSVAEACDDTDMSSAADVGERVLRAFAAGREKANQASKARSRELAAMVFNLAHLDQHAGKPRRGRPGRIARKIGISERHASRILATLLSVSDSEVFNSVTKEIPPNGKRSTESRVASDV